MNALYLPPISRPPHDPLHYRLDRRAGWRTEPSPALTQQVEASPGDGGLTLLPLPGTGAQLNDPSGSFGGLTWPDHVALLPGNTLVLFDRAQGRLRRFDPCTCRFSDWPCVGRDPKDPRLPLDAGGIAASCGRLYLCDTGHRRVLVLNPVSGTVQAVWTSPVLQGLVPWQPEDAAVMLNGDVVVSDPANGCIHVFSAYGRHRRFFGQLGAVRSLAVDCLGRIYIRVEGEPHVLVLDPDSGKIIGTPTRPGEIINRFLPLPVRMLVGGALDLSDIGRCHANPPPIFDTSGKLTTAELPFPVYPKEGMWVSLALDSEITRCLWHRAILTGALPPGTRVTVYSWTAESEEPADLLALRPVEEWRLAGTWHNPDAVAPLSGQIDFLLRSQPGRYLWLKLQFQGDGSVTPQLDSVEIEFPRISLRRYLPAVFGAEPVSADFTDRWLALFDREFRSIETTIDRQARLFDPLACPAGPPAKRDFLGWLAGWVGVALERNWPEERRRAYLKAAPQLFPWRGTLKGLRKSLYLFLAIDRYTDFQPKRADCVPCVVPSKTCWRPPRLLLEHFHLRRWMMLGHAKLSDNAKLWGERIVNRSRLGGPGEFRVPDAPSGAQVGVTQLKKTQDPCRDLFHVYAHKLSVFVPAACVRDPSLARALKRLVDLERPAHVETQVIAVEPRFRVGVQAMLGLDAVIGWCTAPVELDGGVLGRATVLTGGVDPSPRFRVGDARVGGKTILP
ncbi:phage tail protein [Nitrospira sp. BLG_1]|uniref:phage tail protein n=1 Tax=Nitrospira sp. BLG_1 TaxID=3395883 RepID=UPI0039BD5E25